MAMTYNCGMISPIDASKYLLSKQVAKNRISNLKLLKLLYCAQGVCLAEFNRPLFSSKFEAWKHGPVIPEVYHEFKKYGSHPIPLVIDPPDLEHYASKSLDLALFKWGDLSASQLRDLTHKESPWLEAFFCHGEGEEISTNDIYQWYLHKLSKMPLSGKEFDRRFESGIKIA